MSGALTFERFVREHTETLYRTAFLLVGNRPPRTCSRTPSRACTRSGTGHRGGQAHRSTSSARSPTVPSAGSAPRSGCAESRWELPERWDHSDMAEHVAVSRTVWQLLGTLSARQRAAVVLRYFHDLPEPEVAAALACRPATVRSLVSRGVTAMRTAYLSTDAASDEEPMMIRDDFDTILRSALDRRRTRHIRRPRPRRPARDRHRTAPCAHPALDDTAARRRGRHRAGGGNRCDRPCSVRPPRHEGPTAAQCGADPHISRRARLCRASTRRTSTSPTPSTAGRSATPPVRPADAPSARRRSGPRTAARPGTHWRRRPVWCRSTFDFGSCGDNGDVHGPCVNSMAFANASDGYLWSLHQLYWTADGGRVWHHLIDHKHPWSGAARLAFVGGRAVRLAPVDPCSSGCAGSVQSAPLGTADFTTTAPGTAPIGLQLEPGRRARRRVPLRRWLRLRPGSGRPAHDRRHPMDARRARRQRTRDRIP